MEFKIEFLLGSFFNDHGKSFSDLSFIFILIQRKSNTSKTNVLLSIGEQERALSAACYREKDSISYSFFHFIPPLCWLLLPIFH